MRRFFPIPLLMLYILLSAGCIHTYPKGEPENPSLVSLSLELQIDHSFDSLLSTHRSTSLPTGYYRIALNLGKGTRQLLRYDTLLRHSPSEENTIRIPLPGQFKADSYEVTVWMDCADPTPGNHIPLHYDISDLTAVSILPYWESGVFSAAQGVKPICLSASSTIDLRDGKEEWGRTECHTLQLHPPIGIIAVEATDIDAFLRLYPPSPYSGSGSVRLTFSDPAPLTFNLLTDSPSSYSSSLSISSPLPILDSSAPTLLYFPLFSPQEGEMLRAELTVYNPARQIVARTGNIAIPLQRDKVSVIKGAFLTNFIESPISIEYEWQGEIIINV